MSVKRVKFSFEARDRMLRGVDMLSDAVRVTLGPRGRNVLIERSFGAPRITKDGVTVAKEIELDDNFENMGAQMVREVASKTSYAAGDGTTTAIVLAAAIAREGAKAVAAGANPMDLKRGIDIAIDAVVDDLRRHAKKITASEEIAQVGTISANGESQIGGMLAEAIRKIGHDGVITVEESTSTETELEVVEGMQFDRGYLSPYFVTDTQKMRVEMRNPYILICDNRISALQELLPLLEAATKAGEPLLIIADDVEGAALATLVVNRMRGGLKIAAVKAPSYGDHRKAILEDIAILTGGVSVSGDLGVKLKDVTLDMLGRARKVIIEKSSTTIVDGAGKPAEIAARAARIKGQIDDDTSDFDREKMKERITGLAGGIAVIRAGGATEFEVRERKDRIDDAMNAMRAAIEEGILPGGGVALLRAGEALKRRRVANVDQNAGIDIVRRTLSAPARQIAINAGLDGSEVVGRILANATYAFGYDAQTGEYGDLIDKGVIDPAKVVRTALQGAASIAGLLVMTEAVVADMPRPPPPELPGHDHDHHGGDIEF
jgi:chaperonin GroEL